MRRQRITNKSSAKRFRQCLPILVEIVDYPCAVSNAEVTDSSVAYPSCKTCFCLMLKLKEWESNDIELFCLKMVDMNNS